MKEEKRRKLQECKEEIRQIVENYINREVKGNQGQLKFLEGLVTGNVAVSIGITLRKDERFWNYLEEHFLKDREDMLSYFDGKKNLESFLRSPYGMHMGEIYEGFCPEFEVPPYLLLRKAQEVMEQACVYYVQLPREELDEEEFGENWKETERMVRPKTKKKEAYVEWLFSIAIYEIFLIEYGRSLPQRQEYPQDKEELEILEKLFPEIFCCRDEERLEIQIDEFCERAGRYYHRLMADMLRLFCEQCYFLHVVNLCAMLRIISLIEFVRVSRNLNSGTQRTKKGNRTALAEAMDLLFREAHWEKCYLFTDVQNSRNLDALARRFQSMYQSFRISPHLSGKEGWDKYGMGSLKNDMALHRYMGVVKERKLKGNTEEMEKELWEASMVFAQPVLRALDAIGGLKE